MYTVYLAGCKTEQVANEVFSSVRLLKMYGWEDSFRERVNEIREREGES
jgi:hypothetical protein